MSSYFTTAEPLNKADIIQVFQNVTTLTKLFVSPFGLSPDTEDILGSNVASSDYKAIYRSWEDSLSRKLYLLSGVPDDRIAASMQRYLEKDQDREVLSVLRNNEQASTQLLSAPSVVELPTSAGPELARAALTSVVAAMKAVDKDFQRARSSPMYKKAEAYGFSVTNSSDVNFVASTLSVDTVEGVLKCLSHVPVPLSNPQTFESLSYDQYIALIEAYADSDEIREELLSLLGEKDGEGKELLRRVRCVGNENAVYGSVFRHPVVAAVVRQEGAESYDALMRQVAAYRHVLSLRPSSSGGNMFGEAEEEQEDSGDTVQVLCSLDEVLGESAGQSSVLVEGVPPPLLGGLLTERAVCRSKMQDFEDALADVNEALLLNPKSSAAYKCRYEIYRSLAAAAAADVDELDGNGLSDDENPLQLPAQKLLMKSAYDALASFVLGGSSNLALAGEAEDAAREACRWLLSYVVLNAGRDMGYCREKAKAYFWRRFNENSADDVSDEDGESSTEDVVNNCDSAPISEGDVSTLCRGDRREGEVCKKCGKEPCDSRTYRELLSSSCMPKRWMVCAFQSLYAPIHTALDIPLPPTEEEQKVVEAYEDGLGEDPAPFDHLRTNDTKPPPTEDEEDDANIYCDQPEGDDDAFKMICRVANAFSRALSAQATATSELTPDTEIKGFQSGILSDTPRCDKFEVSTECTSVDTTAVSDMDSFAFELKRGLNLREESDLQVMVSGMLPTTDSGEISNGVDKEHENSKIDEPEDSVGAPCSSFLEAFSIVTSPTAHELTGVTFKWRETAGSLLPANVIDSGLCSAMNGLNGLSGDTSSGSSCENIPTRFRISASLTDEMQEVICDRSMHNSMHNVDYSDVDSDESLGGGAVSDEEESCVSSESQGKPLRKVSRQLRARLISLCGSIAYLCGDAMGGYQCMKASIMLDGDMLDSRIKISTMLMEMDELDKAEVHLRDASRKWPSELVVDLHQAELSVHQTNYMSAAQALRKASRRIESETDAFVWAGQDDLDARKAASKRAVIDHLGPSVSALLGVAEFRVDPENPERALQVLQQGTRTYPTSTSILICLGEVLSQAGDPAGALAAYEKACKLDPHHPMPYINASRVYQQLNQMQLAKKHMMKALEVDRSLSLTLVDIAQFKIHEKRRQGIERSDSTETRSGHVNSATKSGDIIDSVSISTILDYALNEARHVSEIIDVITAKQISEFYNRLQESGLAPCVV